MLFISTTEILLGQVIPIPFFPDKLKIILEYSPFTGVQNIPLRIFSGDINGTDLFLKLVVQIFWLVILILIGKLIASFAEKKLIVQGC